MSDFVILHTCEHHAAVWPTVEPDGRTVGGIERRATVARRERDRAGPGRGVILLDSGDILYGATANAAFEGRADIAGMTAAGYDAMGCGNHDFDLGPGHLARLADNAGFPIIASNIDTADGAVVSQSATVETSAGRVFVTSVVSKDVFGRFNPRFSGLYRFTEPVPCLAALIERRPPGVDLVVVITHQRTEDDLELAARLPSVDVIVGGHVAGYPGVWPAGAAHPVSSYVGPGPIVVKAPRLGRFIGRLNVERLADGILRARSELIEITMAIPPDPATTAALKPFADVLDEPVAAGVPIDGNLVALRRGTASTARLVAAAMRWKCGTDLSMVLAGGVFSAGLAGTVRYRDVIDLVPYRSLAVTVRLSPDRIHACLEHGLAGFESLAGSLVVTDGLTVTVDPTRPPGSRVAGLGFVRPPGPDGKYSAAVQDYMASGGAGFDLGTAGHDTGIAVNDCVADYLRAGMTAPGPAWSFTGRPAEPWSCGETTPEFIDGQTML